MAASFLRRRTLDAASAYAPARRQRNSPPACVGGCRCWPAAATPTASSVDLAEGNRSPRLEASLLLRHQRITAPPRSEESPLPCARPPLPCDEACRSRSAGQDGRARPRDPLHAP